MEAAASGAAEVEATTGSLEGRKFFLGTRVLLPSNINQDEAQQLDDVENQQPDGARKWKPDASPIWLELRVDTKLSKTVDPDEHAMDSLLV